MIDIHVHGIAGFDTRTSKGLVSPSRPEDILKIAEGLATPAEAHGSKGVASIVPAIYPASIEKMRADMEAVKRAMKLQGLTSPSKGLKSPIGGLKREGSVTPAWILGVHLEGPFLNPARCGALDKESFLEPTQYNLNKLIEGYEDIVKIITIAPELDGALKIIKNITDMGIAASMGHSNATFDQAGTGYNAGARGVTHLFNAMSGFHHREPGLAGFGLMNKDVYVEVIGDPYHLHMETLKLIFSVKNPDRIILISDLVKGPFRDESGKLYGGSMSIAESSKRLVEMGISGEVVKKAVTENPERYLAL